MASTARLVISALIAITRARLFLDQSSDEIQNRQQIIYQNHQISSTARSDDLIHPALHRVIYPES